MGFHVNVGNAVGREVGWFDGSLEGCDDGCPVGSDDTDGCAVVGAGVGFFVGSDVGLVGLADG